MQKPNASAVNMKSFSSISRLACIAVTLIAISDHYDNSCLVHSFVLPSSSLTIKQTNLQLQASKDDNDSNNRFGKVTAAIGSTILTLSILLQPVLPATAADYASFSDEQRFVAEAWRTVDNAYIDRTFNHQDWFKLRQDAIKKKYKNMAEAQTEVENILSSLGDRYTRYLPPAKYDSIVNAATGNVYGVGVELAQDTEKVIAADVEPGGPAAMGGLKPNDVFVEVDGVRFDDGKATPGKYVVFIVA